jgi:hypothetical protein
MRKMIGTCVWAALLAAGPGAVAQEASGAKAQEAEKAPGRRLRVQFQETRQQGEATTASRPWSLLLHADAGRARLFIGTMAAITWSEKDGPTTIFKNVGVTAEVTVMTLPDGRYAVDGWFEASHRLRMPTGPGEAPVTAGNPILQAVQAQARLTLREGETVPFASAVDPVTGEVVRIDLALVAAPVPKASAPAGSGDARLRARLVLVRRQGATTLARRPYSVTLEAGGKEGVKVFSGSMLPVQTKTGGGQGQTTVALKNVGAGLQLKATRIADGRYRLDVNFSDGVLGAGEVAPELRVFNSESEIYAHEGETMTLASAVDPQTGEVVEAELTIEVVR